MSDKSRFTTALQTIVTRNRSPLFRWSLSLGLCVVAFALRYGLSDALPPGFPYLTFFPAVIVTTLLAGLWPGVVSAVLCGLASWFFFIAPANSFALNAGATTALLFYAFIVSVDIVIIHGITVTAQHLKAERESMARLAHSLQRSNLALAERESEQQVLSQEIGHRLKNQLALVQAIVSQTLRSKNDLPGISKTLTERIGVLADAQDMLIAGSAGHASVADIVQKIAALHGNEGQRRIVADGPAIKLSSKPTLTLSMILHELATNATKYGALASVDGVVNINWSVESRQGVEAFVIKWVEQGGPAVEQPQDKGFGSRLVRAGLPSSGSEVIMDFRPDGLVCTISADLAGMQSEQIG
ncbi:HWE histidine kinase domain-containing protein [Devosia sp. J2-20]|uniref:HWE histidine kinase domain-containing protein n=1 Tax=Devosia sp. J2-20 TaxID=3026161 RepID=UPI00249B4863|nr:HWE histidine kinase domain-containing protein [Devosia sp. J2-20]WDQ97559.1 HWE histidine kinase domain-containing protein [Devosia sp. J2-20]